MSKEIIQGGVGDLHKDVYSKALQNVHNDQNLGRGPVVQQLGNNPSKLCHINRILAGMLDVCQKHETLASTGKDVLEIKLNEQQIPNSLYTLLTTM